MCGPSENSYNRPVGRPGGMTNRPCQAWAIAGYGARNEFTTLSQIMQPQSGRPSHRRKMRGSPDEFSPQPEEQRIDRRSDERVIPPFDHMTSQTVIPDLAGCVVARSPPQGRCDRCVPSFAAYHGGTVVLLGPVSRAMCRQQWAMVDDDEVVTLRTEMMQGAMRTSRTSPPSKDFGVSDDESRTGVQLCPALSGGPDGEQCTGW